MFGGKLDGVDFTNFKLNTLYWGINAEELVHYFDQTYVMGTFRTIGNIRVK